LFAPFIKRYPNLQILHITRNPIDVISSLIGTGFWHNEDTVLDSQHKPYRDYINKFIELKGRNPIELSVEYYIKWNKLIENSRRNPIPRVRIEDIKFMQRYNSRKREDVSISILRKNTSDNLYGTLLTMGHGYGYNTSGL